MQICWHLIITVKTAEAFRWVYNSLFSAYVIGSSNHATLLPDKFCVSNDMAENKIIPNELQQMVHWFMDTTTHVMLPSPSLIYPSTLLGARTSNMQIACQVSWLHVISLIHYFLLFNICWECGRKQCFLSIISSNLIINVSVHNISAHIGLCDAFFCPF